MMSCFSGFKAMTKTLFNTSEETATRLTLCIPKFSRPASIEEIVALDLVATYMHAFGFGDSNLHGDTPFAKSEYEARRSRVRQGVNRLVVQGLATTRDGGITFAATSECEVYARRLEGEYVRAYLEAIDSLLTVDRAVLIDRATGAGGRYV